MLAISCVGSVEGRYLLRLHVLLPVMNGCEFEGVLGVTFWFGTGRSVAQNPLAPTTFSMTYDAVLGFPSTPLKTIL